MSRIPNNETPRLCAACKHRCCDTVPGHWMPSQLGTTYEEIRKEALLLLRERKAQLDSWGMKRGEWWVDLYFLRPKKDGGRYKERSYAPEFWSKGPCVYQGVSGCTLDFEGRPEGCQELVGRPEGCGTGKKIPSKLRAAQAWEEYNLEDLYHQLDF